MALTTKQEKFCQEVVKQDTYSDAYRVAYDAENMSDESINVNASKLLKNTKIALRVKELRKEIEKKELYTLEESIEADLRLIKRYEDALDVLNNKDANSKDIDVAQRTIKHISHSGYSSAQDRLAKKQGWFEKDNKQKTIPDRVIVDMSNHKKE